MKILVIGDLMIDRYVYGKVTKISPEAPVPVFSEHSTEDVIGGAGNVALNLKSLGADVMVLGKCSNQHAQMLKNQQINADWCDIIDCDNIKLRYVDRTYNQHMIRIDNEEKINDRLGYYNLDRIRRRLDDWNLDAIVFSDYVKGCINNYNAGGLISYAKRNDIPTILDTRRTEGLVMFRGIDYATPNMKEWEVFESVGFGPNKALLRTESEDGMTFIEYRDEIVYDREVALKEVDRLHIATIAKDGIRDVTGAGDTVTAAFLYFILQKCELRFAAQFANIAAGLACLKHGTSTVNLKEIEDYVKKTPEYRHLWLEDAPEGA